MHVALFAASKFLECIFFFKLGVSLLASASFFSFKAIFNFYIKYEKLQVVYTVIKLPILPLHLILLLSEIKLPIFC